MWYLVLIPLFVRLFVRLSNALTIYVYTVLLILQLRLCYHHNNRVLMCNFWLFLVIPRNLRIDPCNVYMWCQKILSLLVKWLLIELGRGWFLLSHYYMFWYNNGLISFVSCVQWLCSWIWWSICLLLHLLKPGHVETDLLLMESSYVFFTGLKYLACYYSTNSY